MVKCGLSLKFSTFCQRKISVSTYLLIYLQFFFMIYHHLFRVLAHLSLQHQILETSFILFQCLHALSVVTSNLAVHSNPVPNRSSLH